MTQTQLLRAKYDVLMLIIEQIEHRPIADVIEYLDGERILMEDDLFNPAEAGEA